jgi:hypothetical protein
MSCSFIEMQLELQTGIDYTTSDDECKPHSKRSEPKTGLKVNASAAAERGHKKCVKPICDLLPTESCNLIEKHLESTFPGMDYTLTDSDCDKWESRSKRSEPKTGPNVNVTAPADRGVVRELCYTKAYTKLGHLWGGYDATLDVLDELFDDAYWTMDDEVCNRAPIKYHLPSDEEERCVRLYCEPHIASADCDDVKHILEDLSKDAGHHVDWTSDDDVCGGNKKRKQGSGRSHNKTFSA